MLLLLGDQVYADETSEATQRGSPPAATSTSRPGAQVADYEEYTRLYYESWLDPEVRWLLSTVPSCMIFDDHDVIDDWNTSASWLADMRATPWWHERLLERPDVVLGPPAPRQPLPRRAGRGRRCTRPCAVRRDGTEVLRDFAAAGRRRRRRRARWSYRRDFGRYGC